MNKHARTALALLAVPAFLTWAAPVSAQQEHVRVQERACGNDPLPACVRVLRNECGPRPTMACYLTIKRKLDAINGSY